MIKKFITEKDVSRDYSISTSWLQKRRKDCDGPPFVRIGRKILYDVEAVDKWFRGE
jgi:hypothetical protein